jgi:hypothetical protein
VRSTVAPSGYYAHKSRPPATRTLSDAALAEVIEATFWDREKGRGCAYLLDMIEHRFLVRMHRGKIEELVTDPGPLEPYDFAIRAGRETWEGFCSEVPPPMCHGIWSATFQRDMTLEGNHLVIMQNLRVLTRQLELLRITGPLG